MPVALDLSSVLPPVVGVTGAPSLLAVGIGELHLTVQIDLGKGFVPLLELAVNARAGASLAISGNGLRLALDQLPQVGADVLANPFGLSLPDVDRFIQFAVPSILQVEATLLPPIPLPPLPQGITLKNLHIGQDGAQGDYITISGDLR